MFDAGTPPPPPSAGGTSVARYNYLTDRLRNRQITMEEATELFRLQERALALAIARAPPVPPPPPPDGDASVPPVPPPPPAAGATLPLDDAFWMGLLAVGAGAGLLAAVLKRSRDGPPAATASRTSAR